LPAPAAAIRYGRVGLIWLVFGLSGGDDELPTPSPESTCWTDALIDGDGNFYYNVKCEVLNWT
jgi:hypothetical protein